MNRAIIFDRVRTMLGRGFSPAEVEALDRAISDALVSVPTSVPSGVPTHALKNADAFYNAVRKITGPLDQVQVDIINRLLTAASGHGLGWIAYEFATAWHESRLKPIEEWGKGKGREYGKINSTGKAPYGRGLVQLTWHDNYVRADTELGLNGTLAKNYDRALEPEIAVKILVRGMAKGWFTGKSLGTYIGTGAGTLPEFKQARRIINGTDKQDLIAGLAVQFQDAFLAGGWA